MFKKLCNGRCHEFFEGDNNRLSMMRLTAFLAFWPSSYVVIETRSETALGWFLSVYVLGYVGGKACDVTAQWAPKDGQPKGRMRTTRTEETSNVRVK